jgi:hypothetical protein
MIEAITRKSFCGFARQCKRAPASNRHAEDENCVAASFVSAMLRSMPRKDARVRTLARADAAAGIFPARKRVDEARRASEIPRPGEEKCALCVCTMVGQAGCDLGENASSSPR